MKVAAAAAAAAAAGGGAKGSEVVVQKEAVENAVRFLNHPKVQSSPLGKRMAFLEHKGLNDAEIALALKRANITPDDIKRAMELADSAAASTTTTSAATPPSLPTERAAAAAAAAASSSPMPAPALPARLVQQPPPPAGWGWGVGLVGAVSCFALGSLASFLASKWSLFPAQEKAGRSLQDDKRDGSKDREERNPKAPLEAELVTLRASQEAITNQMREMKEMLESQRQALPIKTEVPVRRASPEDDTIGSLRTEIKALRAMLLDTRTADSTATRPSTVADLASLSIPPASSSSLPSWQMSSNKRSLSSLSPSVTGGSGSVSVPVTTGSKPSAPKPYERKAVAIPLDASDPQASEPLEQPESVQATLPPSGEQGGGNLPPESNVSAVDDEAGDDIPLSTQPSEPNHPKEENETDQEQNNNS